jgi:hypothetical protein
MRLSRCGFGQIGKERATMSWSVGLGRRKLLRGLVAGVVAGSTRVSVYPASAQDKMSKQEAEYQDSPKDIRMCATCTLYEPPTSCTVVEGDVSPNGWCKAFALAD